MTTTVSHTTRASAKRVGQKTERIGRIDNGPSQKLPNTGAFYASVVKTSLPLALGDLVAAYLGILAGWVVTNFMFGINILAYDRLFIFLPYTILLSLLFHRTYPLAGVNPAVEFQRVGLASAQAFALVGGFCLVHYENGIFMASVLVTLVGVPTTVFAFSMRRFARNLLGAYQWWGIPLVFVGNEPGLHKLYEAISNKPWLGYRPIGYIGNDAPSFGHRHLGNRRLMREIGLRENTYVAVADGARDKKDFDSLLSVFPDAYFTSPPPKHRSLWLNSVELANTPCDYVRSRLDMPWHRMAKRMTDIGLCVLAALFLAPLVAVIAVAVRVSSPGPIFYSQSRYGLRGKHFRAWKFRTMVKNADEVLNGYLESNPRLKDEWERDHKLRVDPRITSIGRFLRKSSLDEIPQLWNVFKGEMSLVGPRPIPLYEVNAYRTQNSYAHTQYERVKPGITGLWQISGRNHTTYSERLGYDTYYVCNWSVWLDGYILIRTMKTVLLREGAY